MNVISDFIDRISAWLLSWFGSDPRVEQIRSKVSEACDFLPSVASVAAMLAAANPTVTGVVGIATAFCRAVKASRARSVSQLVGVGRKPIGTVNGVDIEGDDLKRK